MTTNPIDFTTVAKVNSWLGFTTNANDTLVQQLITAASQYLLNEMNRQSLSVTAYDEYYTPGVKNFLVLRQWPVRSVASIQADGWSMTTPATGNPPCNGYQIDPGDSGDGQATLLIHGRCFSGRRMSVRIQYSAGYDSVPQDLEQVCIELVGEKFKGKDRIGLRAKSLPNGENVSFNVSGLSVDSRDALMNYTRVTP